MDAIVDTAAEVTIVSTEIYNAMRHPPNKLKDVALMAAGKCMSMKGCVVGP